MKFLTTIGVMLSAIGLSGLGHSDDKAPAPGSLIQVDLNLNKNAKNAHAPSARPGYLWQFYLIYPTRTKDQRLRTLRVEIEGDSAELIAIVKVPVLGKDGEQDGTKRNISCFISTDYFIYYHELFWLAYGLYFFLAVGNYCCYFIIFAASQYI